MVTTLKKAIKKAESLSAKEQEVIASLINDEISWDEAIAKSKDQLSKLAEEALAEYKKGGAKPLDL